MKKATTWPKILKTPETKLFFLTTIIIIILDQLSKHFVETTKPFINFLFFSIQYSTNTGAGFGILQNQSFILGLISLLAAIVVIYYYPSLPRTKIYSLLAGLFLAGIIGNGIDRLTKQYVVDFIATTFWPSFNVADSAITVSVIIFIILSIKEEINSKKN
ncbi:signal peptidase II [archaeon]|nr:signal peptidase II [archaeon]|tara:strand:- start:909 stop:1388 length:480 start_codon:yes stop_codon:yes gene_type:complete